MSEPTWIWPDEAIALNLFEMQATGEPHLLLNSDLLESALARPKNLYAYGTGDILDMALALLFGIAGSHPFQQGNKRTAFRVAVIFLHRNGYRLSVPDDNPLAERILHVIAGTLSVETFREFLQPFIETA